MPVFSEVLEVETDARVSFKDVTDKAVEALKKSGVKNGLLCVYTAHTTCSVLIQEQSDDVDFWGEQYILQDLVNIFEKVIPTCKYPGQYLHPGPIHMEKEYKGHNLPLGWALNTEAHLRTTMLGRSVNVPIENGELVLGEFGKIYFADFDQVRERTRKVYLQYLGE